MAINYRDLGFSLWEGRRLRFVIVRDLSDWYYASSRRFWLKPCWRLTLNRRILVSALVVLLVLPGNVLAGMSLSTKLHKSFKKIAYPHEAQVVGIEIDTKVDYLPGNDKSADLARAGKVHEMLVREFNEAGWREDDLAADDVTSKNVEIAIGEGLTLNLEESLRLKAFINQCSSPMRKYRGGDVRAFFANEVVGESEYCVTYDNQLEYSGQKGK